MTFRILPEVEQQILELRREQKLSVEKIAEIVGLATKPVRRLLRKYGMGRRILKITPEIGEQILKLNSEGHYTPAISEMLGIRTGLIVNFLNKQNLPKIGRSFNPGFDQGLADWIIELTEQGWGRMRIATEVGLDEGTVRSFLRKIGWKSGNDPSTATVTPEISVQIIQLVSEGFGYTAMADIVERSYDAIRRYCIKNSILLREFSPAWQKEQTELRRLRKVFSKSIHRELRNLLSNERYVSFTNHLPYTIKELKTHLEQQFEPWMTWENWGVYRKELWNDDDSGTWVWHIDHIKPSSEFIYQSMQDEQFKTCWALSNLRPLSAKQNISEGALRIRHAK
jgi:hypothetical protein